MNIYYRKSKQLLLILILLSLVLYSLEMYNIFHFPSQIDIFVGEKKQIDFIYPFTISITDNNKDTIKLNNFENKFGLNLKNSVEIETIKNGFVNIQFKLLGFIPVKNIKVNVIDKIYLTPGGHAIGVKLNTKGVLVVSLSDITGLNGTRYSPAKEAGIRIGDVILEINGIEIEDSDHVIDILNNLQDKKVAIKILRNNKEFTTMVKPVKSNQDNCYRLGLWVRDRTAGIGTLTFYHNETKKFAALGHGITDIDTGSLMPTEDGEIMEAKISSIQQGKKGMPGEIRGIFFESENLLGKIEKNSKFGIYGTAYKDISNNIINNPLPVGLQYDVKKGNAYILTTTEDNKIEKYQIKIIKTEFQTSPSQKSMIIEVSDPKLIKKTGGIVQGMSGSPIIQDGKIIGAVTHVFVNDPTKGYGLYIEWMLKELGIVPNENKDFALVE